MSVRARQLLVVATGVVAAAVMIVLGLWQAQVFVDQGNRSASERAAQAPIPLEDFVHPDGTIGDVYGKRVVASGRYQGKQLAVVGEDGQVRVLTAFELADGRARRAWRRGRRDGAAAGLVRRSAARRGLGALPALGAG